VSYIGRNLIEIGSSYNTSDQNNKNVPFSSEHNADAAEIQMTNVCSISFTVKTAKRKSLVH